MAVIAFLCIYWKGYLNPTNDKWIMSGYDETDIIQHYSGWIAFRNSDWSFPLGLAKDMAVPEGTCISFTDSIPWVAIFFKIFRGLLPETFQYFGLYLLLSYILQGIASFKVIEYKTKSLVYSLIGEVLLLFVPCFLDRSLRHTALSSQWLILFSILVWMKHKESYRLRTYIYYLVFLVLAIGIHPYFLPMIGMFMLLSVIDDIQRKKFLSIAYLFGSLGITCLTGLLIGVLGTGVKASRDGYGFYSMNLNSLLNPTSIGGYRWSAFLGVRPQTLGNYEGFLYAGVGVMAGLLVAAVLLIIKGDIRKAPSVLKRNIPLIAVCVFCTLFAISNTVTYDDMILFKVPLPKFIEETCGIFRSSARILYPVFYLICIGIILTVWKYGKFGNKRAPYYIMLILCVIQIMDLRYALIEKNHRMQAGLVFESILDDPGLNSIFEKSDSFMIQSGFLRWDYAMSIVPLKHHNKLYYSTAVSGSYDIAEEEKDKICSYVERTGDIGKNVMVTDNPEEVARFISHDNIGYYELNGLYYMADMGLSEYLHK